MELYTPGYKVTEILDETGDSLRRINVNDAELSYKLTSLFMNAKGRTREDANKEGRVPIVAKLLLMRLNHENIPKDIILFDERCCPDRKNKVSIPGGHVECEDVDICGNMREYYNIIHAAIFREIIEELEGEYSFDDSQRMVFTKTYCGNFLSILPELLSRYGFIMYNPDNREPNIYYHLTREYEDTTGNPFILFYVPVYVKDISEISNPYYKWNCDKYINFDRDDYNYVNCIKRSGHNSLSLFKYEYGDPAKDDVRLVSDDKPKSRIIPAIFNTEELWNPIK